MTDKTTDPASVVLGQLHRFRNWQPSRCEVEILATEIERLRARLAKIANAPVPSDHPIALMLKAWAMPHEGEYPYA